MGPALRLIPGLILRMIFDLVLPSQLVLYMYVSVVDQGVEKKEERGVLRVGSIPVEILPSCQYIDNITSGLYKN